MQASRPFRAPFANDPMRRAMSCDLMSVARLACLCAHVNGGSAWIVRPAWRKPDTDDGRFNDNCCSDNMITNT